jgi:hypothetical protein
MHVECKPEGSVIHVPTNRDSEEGPHSDREKTAVSNSTIAGGTPVGKNRLISIKRRKRSRKTEKCSTIVMGTERRLIP